MHLYHPNKANKGFACSFWYSQREQCLFARLIRQSGWDSQKSIGVFKDSLKDPNKNVTIKLSFIEAGAIIDCIETNRPYSSFHQDTEKSKTIRFEPWVYPVGSDQQKGYSFSVTVVSKQDSNNKNPFYIGLTYGEARLIKEILINAIHNHLANSDNGNQQPNETAAATEEISPEPVEEEPQQSNNPPKKLSKDPLIDF